MHNIKSAIRLNKVKKSAIREIFDSVPSDFINLGLGELQFSMPDFLKEEARRIISEEKISYTPNPGLTGTRKSISEYYGSKVSYENVCVTVGAEEALFVALNSYVNPGDEVLLANPTFLAYKTIIEMCGGEAITFDLNSQDNFSFDRNHFISRITEKTKVILLCHPSNPLSVAYSDKDIEFIHDVCKNKKVLLIVDEIYRDLYINKKITSFYKQESNILVISGLSKSYCMTGWRLGWVIAGNKYLLKPIINCHQYAVTCAPYISQRLAEKALSIEGLKSLQNLRDKLFTNYFLVSEILEKNNIKFITPQAYPYLFFNIHGDDFTFCRNLSAKGVVLIPGSSFGEQGVGWVRLSYALELSFLEKGLEKVLSFLM